MEYTITITEQDFPILSMALVELPYKISAPLIDKLNRQIVEQTNKNINTEKTKKEKIMTET